GTDKVNAIINCHLATGRIGKPGQGPFSFTGQPNAMGGREVGGLANQLAAHMDFSPGNIEIVSRFWNATNMASNDGLKAVDMFRAIEEGKIKAIWIMATNPAVSMPEANQVERALKQCEFVVVSDCVKETDTSRLADVLLPAAAWGEKDGTVTNSERCISHQRAFLPVPGDARPDWWIVSQVAQRLGYQEEFNYTEPVEIFREHAGLSGYKNQGGRDFDISGFSEMTELEYQRFRPTQWPYSKNLNQTTGSMFSNHLFYHEDRKARFIAVNSESRYREPSQNYPFILNTGRVRDQWHTMTRTGKSPRLSSHRPEPYVEIHPDDAKQYQLVDDQLVKIESQHGSMLARTQIRPTQKTGNLFIPMHWNNRFASSGKVGPLVNAIVDPVSGQPQFKHTPVNIKPLQSIWRGFILTRKLYQDLPFPYWVRMTRTNCLHFEIAGFDKVDDWSPLVRKMEPDDGDWIEFQDKANGYYRAAHIADNRLNSCFFFSMDDSLPDDQWLDSLFSKDILDQKDRLGLLSGQPTLESKPAGKTICACFNVGLNTIMEAIEEQKLTTVEAIGEALQAGTNCGSCIPEIDLLIKDVMARRP
ncbi:molybdopterin-dependent oxidoreductase, partial [Kaarinaea lacus]